MRTPYINGGGAFHAADKIIQFNGRGAVAVKNFFASDYGKVTRSCGINTNYGGTCRVTNSCQNAAECCDRY